MMETGRNLQELHALMAPRPFLVSGGSEDRSVRWKTLNHAIAVNNLLGVVVIYMTLLVPQVIILESFLSFLGLGVQEPMTSWGVLISAGAKNIGTANWLLFFPAFFLVSTLFALNFIGDGLRDALDPKDR